MDDIATRARAEEFVGSSSSDAEEPQPARSAGRRDRAPGAADTVPNKKSIWTGISRGLARRCPNCGVGRLFNGFLKIRSPCEVCGTDNSIYPSDDFPPYLTIFVTGHVVITLFIWTDADFQPPFWLEAAIWLPLTVIMCLVLLPFMKGATIGLCWAANIVREESAT